MAFLKHVGRHANTGQRLIVVFMELPDEPDQALVLYSDSLPDRYHQSLMEAVESPEGQASKQFYEVMTRKVFWHGTPMLQTMHQERFLVKVPTKDVIMTPNSNNSIPLNELNEQLHSSDEQVESTDTSVDEVPVVEEKSRVDTNVEESKLEESKQIAQNLMIQAELLEKDAEAKRQEAYKYDPSLKTEAVKETPKKRGRPKKADKESV